MTSAIASGMTRIECSVCLDAVVLAPVAQLRRRSALAGWTQDFDFWRCPSCSGKRIVAQPWVRLMQYVIPYYDPEHFRRWRQEPAIASLDASGVELGMYFDRDGRPMPFSRWVEACSPALSERYRRVGNDRIGPHWVTSIWLGIDYSFGRGEPLIFETALFVDYATRSTRGGILTRSPSREAALAVHRVMVELAERALSDPEAAEQLRARAFADDDPDDDPIGTDPPAIEARK